MPDLLLIVIAAALVNHWVLTQPLGRTHAPVAANRLAGVVTTSLLVAPAIFVTGVSHWLLSRHVLRPLQLDYLHLLVLVMLSSGAVWMMAMLLRRRRPESAELIRACVPVALLNPVALAAGLVNETAQRAWNDAWISAVGLSCGAAGTMITLTLLLNRIEAADIPAPFRGAPIALITGGLMALAAMGLAGVLPE